MLQPANCSLEGFKTWQACNRFRQGIPLDNCKGKEWILIIVSGSLQLSEDHQMAVSRDAGRWLDLNRHRDCNKVIHYLVEEAEASICSNYANPKFQS